MEKIETYTTKEVEKQWYLGRWEITQKKRDKNEPKYFVEYAVDKTIPLKNGLEDLEALSQLIEEVLKKDKK